MRRLLFRASIVVVLASGTGVAIAYVTGPPPARTGAPAIGGKPAEFLCTACHSGAPVNDTGGSLVILGVPSPYVPNQTYPIRVRLSFAHPGSVTMPEWGFEITAVAGDGDAAGTFTLPDGAGSPGFQDSLLAIVGTGSFSTRNYVTHSEFSTRAGQFGAVEWRFDWTAPATDVGLVGFFASGNAANGNFSFTGDHIFTTSAGALGPSLVSVPGASIGPAARLEPARPNPFATDVELNYATARAGRVSLRVYDLQGRKVRTLVEGVRPAGDGRAFWDGANDGGAMAPNGTYFVRFQGPDGASAQRTVTLAR